jgi:K+/H+ antiporter YhaU regulatory subunit KhtT
MLELVKSVGHGSANIKAISSVFQSVANNFKTEAKHIAKEILTISAEKIKPVIKQLTREYKLDESLIEFVGGGGGASAIVPFTAEHLKVPHKIADNSEVISAIGAALGIIRDSVEKNIINPNESDLISLRQEAINSVISMGAAPDSIEVTIEIDNQNKRVIATAMGSSEMRTRDLGIKELSEKELVDICSKSLKVDAAKLKIKGKTETLYAIVHEEKRSHFFGLLKNDISKLRVIDKEGTIKLQVNDCITAETTAAEVKSSIVEMISSLTTFGDAGALVPDIFILIAGKILDMTGLMQDTQILSMADIELKKVLPSEKVVIIAAKKK